mgnify:CR=1 FL=1
MKNRIKWLLFLGLASSPLSVAAPAPWYLWQSNITGGVICAQHSPGDGWSQLAGSFSTAGQCKQAIRQKTKP